MNIIRSLVLGAFLAGMPSLLFAAPVTLCSANEEVIFSCIAKQKMYEICASKGLSATSGYMQYRAGVNGKVDFVFPNRRVVPAGNFKFNLLARGAELSFQDGELTYEIVEPLIGTAEIWGVRGNGDAIRVAECQNFTESLTLTTTQNRFKSLGIYE